MRQILLCLVACLLAHPAYAYRPFNSTDAAVAERGEMEIECGPLGYVVDVDGRFLVVPAFILNFGIAAAIGAAGLTIDPIGALRFES